MDILDDMGLTKVYVSLWTDDVSGLSQHGYKEYWFDNIERVLNNILNQ